MSRPSVYDETLDKDQVVEDRDQVKVVFMGGNSFRLYVEGMGDDEYETARGKDAAWKRAEAIRKDLNPDYEPPASDSEETQPAKPASTGEASEGAKAPVAKTETPKAEAKGGNAEPEKAQPFTVGPVDGKLAMMPVDLVLDMIGPMAGRVELLRGSTEARLLARRVHATDGRCAPIFFTKTSPQADELPALFAGLETLAAAKNLDMKKIAVVMLLSDDAREAQGAIAQMMRNSMAKPEADDDAELQWKVQAAIGL